MTVHLQLTDAGPRVRLTPAGEEPREVFWGHPWQIGTAAYWVAVTEAAARDGSLPSGPSRHRLGRDLAEEVAACLLGGHGMPFETGRAAFEAVRDRGLLTHAASRYELEVVLSGKLTVGERQVRYRFPHQRAAWLAEALDRVWNGDPPTSAMPLREWLLTITGVGPKTAGWVVRNYLASDDVAIVDVHVWRAGVRAGVFDASWSAARNYPTLEAFFLEWAQRGSVAAADLDAVVWAEQANAARANAKSRRRALA